MPVVRNPQFYFKEGFCWTDINSTFLKSRLKTKGVFDVVSMSLFTQTQWEDWYYVCLINSDFMSLYVDNFINNTSHFQINDARQAPIIIPTQKQYEQFRMIFFAAQTVKKELFAGDVSETTAEERLHALQNELEELIGELYSV